MKRIITATALCVLIALVSGCYSSAEGVDVSLAPIIDGTDNIPESDSPEETEKPETTINIAPPETTINTTPPEITLNTTPPETTLNTTPLGTTINTTPPETTPPPKWTETAIQPQKKYLSVPVYSREEAVLGANTVKLYYVNDEVTVIAVTDTGYYKLQSGEFIHSDFLSDEKTVIATTTTTPAIEPEPEEIPGLDEYKDRYISSGYPPS